MEETIRVEWRDTPKRDEAVVALCRQWVARHSLYGALVGAVGLLIAVGSGPFCGAFGIGIPCAAVVYWCGSAYWRNRARVDRKKVAAWNAARRSTADSFREPARQSAEEEARWLSIDAAGVSLGARTSVHYTMRWAGVKSVRRLRDGHVVFLAHGGMHFFVPSWAFEADAQRTMVIEHARTQLASAPVPPVPEEASELGPQEDAFEVAAPVTLRFARLQFGPTSIATLLLFCVFAWIFASGTVSIVPVPAWVMYPLFACIAISVLSWASPSCRTLFAFRRMRAHVVHRVRFSELGVSIASALTARTVRWQHAALAKTRDAIVVDGLALPRGLFDAAQIDKIFAWKGPSETPAPAQATPAKKTWRTVALWTLLILMFVAVYQLVQNHDEEEAASAPTSPPTCVLPPSAVPGVPLGDEGGPCADVIETIAGADSVLHCGAVRDSTLDGVAVVTADDRTIVWLRIFGEWTQAGETMGTGVVAARALDLVHGGTPEILLVTETDPSTFRAQHAVTLCGIDGGQSRCWWTLPLARSEHVSLYDSDPNATNPPDRGWCQGYRYDLALGEGERLSFVYAEPPSDAPPLPQGAYTIDELARYDACPAPTSPEPATRTARRCPVW